MPPLRTAALALSLLGTMAMNTCDPRRPGADLIVYGRVWTGDPQQAWAQAVAVAGDTILAVGDSATLEQYAGSHTRRIDNGGGMVVPGLNDSHTHFIDGGFQLTSVDLRSANTPAEFIQRLRAFAQTVPAGQWIIGGDWDHERWAGSPLPRRDWIDSVTPNNPVFVNRLDGHMALANSLALKAAHIDRSTPDHPGGTIVRDRNGSPTGILKDDAMGPVYAAIPEPAPEQQDSALARAMRYAGSLGITAVSAVSVPWGQVAAWRRAHARGAMTVRVSLYPPLEDWHKVADTVAASGPGDKWLRLAGVKGYVDGSLGSATALLTRPYLDEPSTYGLTVTPPDSLRRWIGAADSAGLQIAIHAIGDSANKLLLDIYDSVAAAHGPRDRRFRIEHAQHLRPEDIARIAEHGYIASMQPYHAIDDGRWAAKRIGPDLIKTTYAFRSLLDQGAHVAFGSDWTVAPLDPVTGIYAAVTRRTLDGKNPEGWVPEQKIKVEEALHGYTYEPAYAAFAEQDRGMLRPGYLADLVLLDRDLTAIPPASIEDTRVKATIVGGKVVYQSGAGN